MVNDWHSAAVICDFKDGEYHFLVQDSVSTDPKWSHIPAQTKCVGGGKKPRDKDPIDTIRREIKEEISLRLSIEVKPRLLCRNDKGNHTQYFYLVWLFDLKGKIRGRKTITFDGDSALYNLRLISVSEIGDVFPSHGVAIRRALSLLQNLPIALVG